MMQVEELLRVWRDAERVLDTISPLSPDHEIVRMQVARLRDAYQAMTDRRPASEEVVALSHATLRDTQALLDRMRINGMATIRDHDPQPEPA